jgi:Na+/melibiose symporter-like transporter
MYLLFSLSVGMWTGVLFLYLDTYLGFEKQTATIFFLFSLAAMVSIPLWGRLAERTHKTRVLCVGIGLQLLSLVVSIPLSPGVPILLPVLTLSGVYIGMAGFSLITPAILADIVDYGAWKFRQNRGSTYFSLLVLAFKAASGLGAGLSLALLAGFSYDPKGQSGGPWAETGMLIAFLGLPACLSLIALWLAWATPITRRRHRAIRRRLEARAAAPAIG